MIIMGFFLILYYKQLYQAVKNSIFDSKNAISHIS